MAITNVNIRNFDSAFVVGARGGEARFTTIKNEINGKSVVAPCKTAAEYEAGSARTPVVLSYAAALLHRYTEKVQKGEITGRRVMFALPDDAAIRTFEIGRLFRETDELDDIVDVAIKPWMRDSEAWTSAIAEWCTAYADAYGADISVGTMKQSNIFSWAVTPDEGIKLEDGMEITLKDGTFDGGTCENNRVSGKFAVRYAPARTGEYTQAERWSIPRAGNSVELKNMQTAMNLLRDTLPHRQEAVVAEAADF
nr:MAG TPA: hypothetical protein [Caudoviricetes sp.]